MHSRSPAKSLKALATAHEHDVVHRDIKRRTSCVGGHAIVADFGIAAQRQPGAAT